MCIAGILVLLLCGACGLGGSQLETPTNSTRVYRLKPGDNLWEVGQRFGISADLLQRYNRISDPKSLRAGSIIKIPPRAYAKALPPKKSLSSSAGNSSKTKSQASPSNRSVARLAWPIRTGRYMSGFGPRGRKFHDGIDIAAKSGTPIYASHTGVVAYSGSGLTGYGKLIIVKGRDKLYTVYAHNRKIFVRKGQNVKRGQKIAEVGATGKASGPHLHFEVRMKDSRNRVVALDPIPLLNRFAKRKPRYRVNESLTPILAKLGWN